MIYLSIYIGLVVATDRNVFDPAFQGDDCDATLIYSILSVYTLAYGLTFLYLARAISTAVDNFGLSLSLSLSLSVCLISRDIHTDDGILYVS